MVELETGDPWGNYLKSRRELGDSGSWGRARHAREVKRNSGRRGKKGKKMRKYKPVDIVRSLRMGPTKKKRAPGDIATDSKGQEIMIKFSATRTCERGTDKSPRFGRAGGLVER